MLNDVIPALAISVKEDEFIILSMESYEKLVSTEASKYLTTRPIFAKSFCLLGVEKRENKTCHIQKLLPLSNSKFLFAGKNSLKGVISCEQYKKQNSEWLKPF